MAEPTFFEIGSSVAEVQRLDALGIPAPQYRYADFSQRYLTGAGIERGAGFATAEWHYGFLTSEQFDALKPYCSSGSDYVVIATYNNARELKRYSCVMTMPETYTTREKTPGVWVYIDVTIKFSFLAEAE